MTGFADSVGKWSQKTQKEIDVKVRATTLDLFRSIILMSPVGNPTLWKHKAPKGYVGGRFRANWNTSVGQPNLGTTAAIDPSGAAAISGVMTGMGGAGTVTYMANGLPYGERLEYEGWSKQAPAGFVRVNVARVAETGKT